MSYLFYKHYLNQAGKQPTNSGVTPKKTRRRVTHAVRREKAKDYERMIDEELAGTFPASDPPSWTMGGSILGAHGHH